MNGYLCIGGGADGQYHNPGYELRHGDKVMIAPRIIAPASFSAFTAPEQRMNVEQYKAWQWFQGEDRRCRLYLIPAAWDGFEAMDWLERKAYSGLED